MRANARRGVREKLARFAEWIVALGLLSVFLPSPLYSRTNAASSLDVLAQDLQTPEAVRQFMARNFLYVEDRLLFNQAEYWQSPEEMLQRKKGDCEDFAAFAEAILKRNGYKVFLFSAFWEEDAHTVAVFERDGEWGIFDIDRLRLLKKGRSVRDLGNALNRQWSFLGIMRREGRLGLISRRFQNQKSVESDLSLFLPTS